MLKEIKCKANTELKNVIVGDLGLLVSSYL